MQAAAKNSIWRIELWHALLLLVLVVTIGRTHYVDAVAVLFGGVFMGVNFLLLSFAIAWVLTPLADKGRVKAGVALLILKVMAFLALLTALFFRFNLDALSFALGFSTLIIGIIIEALRRGLALEA